MRRAREAATGPRPRSRGESLWIVNHYAASPEDSTGTRHFDLARELAQKGYRVTIIASSFDHQTGRRRLTGTDLYGSELHDGVRFVWIRTPPYERNDWRRVVNMVMYAALTVCLQFRLSRPDVVLGSSVHPLAGIAAYLIARLHRSRFVFEIRDLWPQALIDLGVIRPDGVAARLLRRLEAFLYARASRLIVLWPAAADHVAAFGVDRGRITVIPNGVRIVAGTRRKSTAVNEEWARRLEAWHQSGKSIALYIGAHGRANSLDVIVGCARVLRDRGDDRIRIGMIGDGPERRRLEAETTTLPNIAFLGSIPKGDVQAALERADLALVAIPDVPIYRHGLSLNKLFDYLGAGKPVVMSGDSANNPVKTARAGIITPSGDAEALASAVQSVVDLAPEERRAIGERGRRYVTEHHDVRELASQFRAACGLRELR